MSQQSPDTDDLFDSPILAQVVSDHATTPATPSLPLPPPSASSRPVAAAHAHPWMAELQVQDRGAFIGAYKSNYNNAIIALTNSPEWQGVFGYNEFDDTVWIRRRNGLQFIEPDTKLAELHYGTLHQWFDKLSIEMSKEKLHTAIYAVANLPENKFHPVRDYLESLPAWDGVPLLSHWLEYIFGANDNSEYLSAIGQCWMRCAVARVFEPGIKADTMLIIEGEQGLGKSSALRALAGEWFTDQIAKDLSSVAASQALQGKWIVELSELSSLRKSEVEDVKAFVSRQKDYYRKPYARLLEDIPRQCILAGTTNKTDWLKDDTGGRRFWPFYATKTNLALIREQRDHLWAEALWQYRQGMPLFLDANTTRLAAIEQAKRMEDDEWVELIERFIQHKDTITTQEITTELLAIPVGSVSTIQLKRITGIMSRLGFNRAQIWKNKMNVRGFRRK